MSAVIDFDELLNEVETPTAIARALNEANAKPTILIATQSRTLRNMTSVTLEAAGYRVIMVADAYAVAESLHRKPEIRMVLLDNRISGFCGFQLAKAIQDCDNPMPPVIMFSRRAGWWTRLRARNAGAIGVIKKPVDTHRFLELIGLHVAV